MFLASPRLSHLRLVAIDIWAAGVIMLCFLTGKFPIFQSNDDVEALMEIVCIIGKKKMAKIAAIHGMRLPLYG